jgi:nucleotide-binding universal stress UspA family protein
LIPHTTPIAGAEKGGADLIVVGSHGRSAWARALLGSTSQFVIGHARCSVRVGRSSSTPAGSPLRILVAIDGSPASLQAAHEVARRRWPPGTSVRLLTAVDLRFASSLVADPAPWADVRHLRHESTATTPRRVVEGAAELYEGSNLAVTTVVREGVPARVILQEAERMGAEAIFVGAKGHSRVERVLLGSVSASVAARATCSVEVVRAIPRGGPTAAEHAAHQLQAEVNHDNT